MIKGKIDAVVLVAVMLAYTGVALADTPKVTVSVPEHISGSFEATIEVEDQSQLRAV